MMFLFFNEVAHSHEEFYKVLAYIPSLSYGSGKSNPRHSRDTFSNEHKCLKLVTNQIKHLASGFAAVIMGKQYQTNHGFILFWEINLNIITSVASVIVQVQHIHIVTGNVHKQS